MITKHLLLDSKYVSLDGKRLSLDDTKYNVNLIQSVGGTITASPMSGLNNTIVQLSNTPDYSYKFNGYSLSGATLTGNEFKFNDQNVTVSASFQYYNPALSDIVWASDFKNVSRDSASGLTVVPLTGSNMKLYSTTSTNSATTAWIVADGSMPSTYNAGKLLSMKRTSSAVNFNYPVQSIQFWARNPATVTYAGMVGGKNYDTTGNIFRYHRSVNNYWIDIAAQKYGTAVQKSSVAENSDKTKWHHVAMVQNRNEKFARWYIDGQLAWEVPSMTETGGVNFGWYNDGTYNCSAQFAELVVYSADKSTNNGNSYPVPTAPLF